LCAFADRELQVRTGEAYNLLEPSARASLIGGLLAELVRTSLYALDFEFNIFRSSTSVGLSRLLPQRAAEATSVQYDAFVASISSRFMDFFNRYPVLCRLIGTIVTHWIDATEEFLERLTADSMTLDAVFNDGQPLGTVQQIQPNLSDPHGGMRTVSLLTFQSGKRLLYKPKPLSVDAAYNALLVWLSDRGVPDELCPLLVVPRVQYGWMQYVPHSASDSSDGLALFYRRIGALLAIAHALRAVDLHSSNIIASGNYPFFIDGETLFHPTLEQDKPPVSELNRFNQWFHNESVAAIGLLPHWESDPSGALYDISALGNYEERQTSYVNPEWVHVNTDAMCIHLVPTRIGPGLNLPLAPARGLDPSRYAAEILSGFSDCYRFLLMHKDELLTGPLQRFRHAVIRVVLRPTELYVHLLRKLRSPKYLRDGADYSIELDVLTAGLLHLEGKPHLWPIVAAEIKALERIDVPMFVTDTESVEVREANDHSAARALVASGFDEVVKRIQSLNETDLVRQTNIVETVLRVPIRPRYDSGAARFDGTKVSDVQSTSEVFSRAAESIAVEISETTLDCYNGGLTWAAMEYVEDNDGYRCGPVGYSLYSGCAGIVMFLAAHQAITSSLQFSDIICRSLEPLRRDLADEETRAEIASSIGIGGGTGLGSLVYAFVRVSEWLRDLSLLDLARLTAEAITPALIDEDMQLDVLLGTAGALMGLLTLFESDDDSRWLEMAIRCGEHLVETMIDGDESGRGWMRPNETRCLAGMSHGSAGISYALMRLYRATRDERFSAAAFQAITGENKLFRDSVGNWEDFRQTTMSARPVFVSSWCHGAPGIGLARLGCHSIVESPILESDIRRALATTLITSDECVDGLCCGNFGRLDLMIQAAKSSGSEDLLETARRNALRLVARAQSAGSFMCIQGVRYGRQPPGFFQGLAGIGYQLLRLNSPGRLPSVLIWE
jgi:type 2 lantibiotic biosynthesis protein LanM